MNKRIVPFSERLRTQKSFLRLSLLLTLTGLVVLPLFSVFSAPLFSRASQPDSSISNAGVAAPNVSAPRAQTNIIKGWGLSNVAPFLFMPQGPSTESISVYQSDCTTSATDFNLGDQICVKVTGAPMGTRVRRRLVIADPSGLVQAKANVNSDPQTLMLTLPSSSTSLYEETTTDNRGTWRVNSLSTADGGVVTSSEFAVHDPVTPVANLTATKNAATELIADGGILSFSLLITNEGPDTAQAVEFTDSVPANATFSLALQDSGPAFNCTHPSEGSTGTSTCTISSLPSGATAKFVFVYQLNTGLADGTVITNTATVSSTTVERHVLDNTSSASATVSSVGSTGASCTLDCPGDITVVANATQGGNPGAFVNYSSAEGFGDCGAIASSSTATASGSFFPVGTTPVVITSETGGGSCSFNVTVVTTGAPTISCPGDQTVTASSGETEANVSPGTPTTTPSSGVSVSGQRSDNEALNAPYPVGLTLINWTVTDSSGLTAHCTQRITVNSDTCGTDTENPTITAPADVTSATPEGTTGSCGLVIGESDLGTANAQDNCIVNVQRSGVPAGNFFPLGTTTITYTATDAAGNTATATQLVTVTDGSSPIIAAPEDASYTCLSEVPAAHPSQATRGEVLDDNGNPLPPGPPTDNCGTPIVTVTETSSGAGSTSSPRIITRTYTATDAAGNTASDSQTITVTDPAAPTITAPADSTFQCASEIPAANAANATASDNCGTPTVTVSDSSNNGAGSSASPLVITRTFTATDAAGNTASDSQTITVIDNTAPSVSAPADANYQCASNVPAANAGDATSSDNCGTANVAVTESNNGGAGSTASPLIITRTYTATDAVGNSASDSQTITVVDNTPPVISCPANIVVNLPLNSPATSMAVTYPAPAATDNCSPATVTTDVASGSVFPVGTTTVTATATDSKGNSSSCAFTVTVLYNFTGFLSPVANLPTLNSVNAGKAIPVKFNLSGDKGLNIFAANSPYTISLDCNSSDPGVDVIETVTAGGSSLSYSGGQYNYTWKTESSWAGTCRQLVVKLNDGSEHRANFKFK